MHAYHVIIFVCCAIVLCCDVRGQAPTSTGVGAAYHEQGIAALAANDKARALSLFEEGIDLDPTFASNYYEAALLYCASKDPLWGIMYGEVFMNLERSGKRVEEIGKHIYNVYRKEISFKSDSSILVSFCSTPSTFIDSTEFERPKSPLAPFCTVFEPLILACATFESAFDLESLSRIRSRVAYAYYALKRHESHPNTVIEYQNAVFTAEHYDAYNHWVTGHGAPDAFAAWIKEHEEAWNAFLVWHAAHPMTVSSGQRFHRLKYAK